MRNCVAAIAVTAAVASLAGCLEPVGPPAPEIAIEPEEPTTDDDLVLVLEDLPEDGAGTTWEITWQRGDVDVEALDGQDVVPASETAVGETWSVSVAAVLRELTGPPATAAVTIGGSGDDDDSTADDDDSGADDDDATPLQEPAAANRLCSAGGTSSNDTFTVRSCTGPVEAAPGVASNGIYTVHINKLSARPK